MKDMTKKEWMRKSKRLRNRIIEILGGFPERCPLRAETIERRQKNGGVEEEIIYQTRPGEIVSAILKIPQNVALPAPVILCLHEHTGGCKGGKETVEYFSDPLTRKGYITIAPDAKCFGERRNKEYDKIEDDMHDNAFWNERVTAMNLILEGRTLMGEMLWDLIRLLDYIETRKEVDRNRIGSIGHSMGGLHTWWLMALDRRVKAGVSSCCVSTYKEILKENQVHSLLNYIPGLLKYADIPDIVSLIAPRAFLMLNGRKDPTFPVEGLEDVYTQAKEIYRLFDGRNSLKKQIFNVEHGFDAEMRQIAYKWFDQWL